MKSGETGLQQTEHVGEDTGNFLFKEKNSHLIRTGFFRAFAAARPTRQNMYIPRKSFISRIPPSIRIEIPQSARGPIMQKAEAPDGPSRQVQLVFPGTSPVQVRGGGTVNCHTIGLGGRAASSRFLHSVPWKIGLHAYRRGLEC